MQLLKTCGLLAGIANAAQDSPDPSDHGAAPAPVAMKRLHSVEGPLRTLDHDPLDWGVNPDLQPPTCGGARRVPKRSQKAHGASRSKKWCSPGPVSKSKLFEKLHAGDKIKITYQCLSDVVNDEKVFNEPITQRQDWWRKKMQPIEERTAYEIKRARHAEIKKKAKTWKGNNQFLRQAFGYIYIFEMKTTRRDLRYRQFSERNNSENITGAHAVHAHLRVTDQANEFMLRFCKRDLPTLEFGLSMDDEDDAGCEIRGNTFHFTNKYGMWTVEIMDSVDPPVGDVSGLPDFAELEGDYW